MITQWERPWGGFEQFVHNEAVTVKIITVALANASLQSHTQRDELWQVIDGPADVEVAKAGRCRRWPRLDPKGIDSPPGQLRDYAGTGPGDRFRPLRRGGHRASRRRLQPGHRPSLSPRERSATSLARCRTSSRSSQVAGAATPRSSGLGRSRG